MAPVITRKNGETKNPDIPKTGQFFLLASDNITKAFKLENLAMFRIFNTKFKF